MKTVFITGVTGQDGSYLARFLIDKGYEVHGLVRRSSVNNFYRIQNLIESKQIILHYGDMLDSGSLINILNSVKPDEIYNLAAQSDVHVSFENPVYTTDVNGLGALRLLDAIKICNLIDYVKFYQAGTSEMFGNSSDDMQSEQTPFIPCSPYATSKVLAYWQTVNYRDTYNLFACNGILFNHESPLRGEQFVTRKITQGLARIKTGMQDCLYLGNIYALRDWGHSEDFLEAQWKILQHDVPDDYVIATGIQYSVKDFINKVAKYLDIDIMWRGTGLDEAAIDSDNGHRIIKIDSNLFRPNEVNSLKGDATKARNVLEWSPRISFDALVKEMAEHDYQQASEEKLLLNYYK